ncbi:hypothetical protein VITFI_CDS3340 (plasmid) [Vitreoscilla filiformis]|uniref:histidine kinase n=1 Tax=Vitreoscilla filiformis TaxID=63 RepID=A0A221KJT0_VITFI|nr:DAHL domain-containing protein [Vitreoscilla filiformis]ASM79117.1 hypothetical protein VITFI_CDS3340 [Vitreoscilla filiformis]
MKSWMKATAVAVAAAALLGGLAGLVWKTQTGDHGLQMRVNATLRELRQYDAELGQNVLRARNDIDKNYDALTALRQSILTAQQRLHTDVQESGQAALTEPMTHIAAAFQIKLDQVEHFKTENALLRNSLRYLPLAVMTLREPAYAAKATAVLDQAHELVALMFRYHLAPDEAQRTALLTLLEALTPATQNADALGEATRLVTEHARVVLDQKGKEARVLGAMEQAPTLASLDQLTRSFEHVFAQEEQARQLWRSILAGYAALLLLGLGALGWRLAVSHRALNAANASLARTNETLEEHVQARTQELTDAVAHLKESQAQLVQSEKMASLGQMVAGIAHEINTPLAYINSSLQVAHTRMADVELLVHETAELMRLVHSEEAEQAALEAQFAQVQEITSAFEDSEAIDEMRNLLSDGLHGIEQIRDMVINLKDFSRLDRAKVMDFNVNDGVKSTLKIARNLVKHRDIRTALGEVPLVQCAPSQINQVLLNLITNACHATADQGGQVSIATRAVRNGVVIEVSDNGSGIPANVLPRIFDPFFTTKKVGEGTGLGLSIAQRIVHDHGGRIDVASTVGVGSKFSVYLPSRMKAEHVDSVLQSEPKEPS